MKRKNKEIYHCIMFNHKGGSFISSFTSPYRLTVSAMAKRFFQLTIDEGRRLSTVTNVEFLIEGNIVLGASDGVFLHRHFFALGQSVHSQ